MSDKCLRNPGRDATPRSLRNYYYYIIYFKHIMKLWFTKKKFVEKRHLRSANMIREIVELFF